MSWGRVYTAAGQWLDKLMKNQGRVCSYKVLFCATKLYICSSVRLFVDVILVKLERCASVSPFAAKIKTAARTFKKKLLEIYYRYIIQSRLLIESNQFLPYQKEICIILSDVNLVTICAVLWPVSNIHYHSPHLCF